MRKTFGLTFFAIYILSFPRSLHADAWKIKEIYRSEYFFIAQLGSSTSAVTMDANEITGECRGFNFDGTFIAAASTTNRKSFIGYIFKKNGEYYLSDYFKKEEDVELICKAFPLDCLQNDNQIPYSQSTPPRFDYLNSLSVSNPTKTEHDIIKELMARDWGVWFSHHPDGQIASYALKLAFASMGAKICWDNWHGISKISKKIWCKLLLPLSKKAFKPFLTVGKKIFQNKYAQTIWMKLCMLLPKKQRSRRKK